MVGYMTLKCVLVIMIVSGKIDEKCFKFMSVSRAAIHIHLPWRLKHNLISYVDEQPMKVLKYSELL